ncbi:hypothetical protein NBEOAGPD_3663 [Methylobacterium gregans]|uniref:Flagellar protein FlaG n=1 Tax=Methylobacterium gregans TaxID=374424 RepID=A0AA37HT17_9HYPH|nr:hypothetical protein [Methylobacterium gregans]MDQ0522095.1 hypothetical protein [Methylobacterium gregans]GJD80422.1 hypothetical protein NBEOAGPD_3663 [Methylobacterium gregans]
MSEIGSVQPAERPAPVVAPVPAAPPARAVAAEPERTPLEPAVKLDLSADADTPSPAPTEADYRAQYVRDAEARQMVYQVVDPASGDIVVQLPSVTVLKARAYAEREAAQTARSGTQPAQVDRTA